MSTPKLSIPDVLYRECGVTIQEHTSSVISSPLRRDSSPSFRIYHHPQEELENKSNVDMEYSTFDWGSGTTYNALSLLHALKGHDNWYETYEYVRNNYGISIGKSEQNFENKLPEAIKLIQRSIPFNKQTSLQIEDAIMSFLRRDPSKMDKLLASADLVI